MSTAQLLTASTLERPAAPDAPEGVGRWSPAARRARKVRAAVTDTRLTAAVVVALVVTQRIGVTLGTSQISVGIVIAYLYAAVMVLRHRLVVSRLRAELLVLGSAGALVATAAVGIRGGEYSLNSLLLLLVIYLPWVLRARAGSGRALVEAAGRAFLVVMLVASAIGIVQLGSQLLGVWSYTDYLAKIIPSSFIISGYNTANELSYGSGTIKANAFVFLEPSILSQFCSLAIMIGVMLRVGAWRLLLLAGGLGSAVSGTGLILLTFGGLILVVRARHRVRPRHLVAAGLALVALVVSPVGSLLWARRDEFTQPGSSGYARFVAPYESALTGLREAPIRWITGAGPGTTSTVLPGSANGLGDDVLYTSLVKLVFEYGLIAGGLFVIFLVVANLDGTPWRVVPATLLVMTFVLGGGLLQPETAYLVWLFSGIGATEFTAARWRGRLRPPRWRRRATLIS